MPKTFYLHIGLNQVNPQHYNSWDGKLNYAQADALAMHEIASQLDFDEIAPPLLAKNATRQNILRGIQRFAKRAKLGDLVFISFQDRVLTYPTSMSTKN